MRLRRAPLFSGYFAEKGRYIIQNSEYSSKCRLIVQDTLTSSIRVFFCTHTFMCVCDHQGHTQTTCLSMLGFKLFLSHEHLNISTLCVLLFKSIVNILRKRFKSKDLFFISACFTYRVISRIREKALKMTRSRRSSESQFILLYG